MQFLNIIPTNIDYTSRIMNTNITNLKSIYPFIEIGSIGYSVLGDNIPYIRIGRGSKEVLYASSFHANEWITSVLLMKFIENYCSAIRLDGSIYGFYAKSIFYNTSIYIVPMVNPDGVNLVTGSLPFNSKAYRTAKTISNRFPHISFPSDWKANIRGVDLNLQFPANWEQAKRIKFSQGFISPAPRDFVGYAPLTEPEALSLYNFTIAHNFRLILAYHTQGKEIYWQFKNYVLPEAKAIGKIFSTISGYTLTNPEFNSSFAGYKDWFVKHYKRPGYTIEAGFGKNPLPLSQFDEIYNDNIGILILGAVL